MTRMTDRAKKIYIVIYRTFCAVFAAATVILCILYFTVDSLKEVFIIKNFPIIVVGISSVMFLIRILVEDVVFRKDFHTIPGKSNNEKNSDIIAEELSNVENITNKTSAEKNSAKDVNEDDFR